MIDEILSEIPTPDDITTMTSDIEIPATEITLNAEPRNVSDIFKVQTRVSWDKTVEARCDFRYNPRLVHRASLFFFSIWQKSVYGRTLTDIKSDDDMIPFFAENMVPFITESIGSHLNNGTWAIVTTPMRRHKEHNFASLISEQIAEGLGIPFYFDCAHCDSHHRVGAEFTPVNVPKEPNIIVFDDFVTTGSTLLSMKNLLISQGKNIVLFAGINNKI